MTFETAPSLTNKMSKITKSILWFLLNYRHPDSMIGDIEEMYNELKVSKGLLYARLWLWLQVVAAIPKYFTTSTYWGYVMFKNYLKISIRNIIKHKSFSFINIFGLAMGLTVSILIMLWVQDELSYDKYNKKANDIYLSWLVIANNDNPDQGGTQPTTSHELLKVMDERFPEVINSARLFGLRSRVLKYESKMIVEENGLAADPSVFDIFTFPIIEGDDRTPSANPHSIVLTEDLAKKQPEFPLDVVYLKTL